MEYNKEENYNDFFKDMSEDEICYWLHKYDSLQSREAIEYIAELLRDLYNTVQFLGDESEDFKRGILFVTGILDNHNSNGKFFRDVDPMEFRLMVDLMDYLIENNLNETYFKKTKEKYSGEEGNNNGNEFKNEE